MRSLLRLAVTAAALTGTPAMAFDDSRAGFMLGLGAGFHSTDLDFLVDDVAMGSESKSGLATSIKIGGGFTEQFLLYYVRQASWFSATYTEFTQDSVSRRNVTTTLGLSGLGASYYLEPKAPSAYVHGALGIGDIASPFESDIEAETGVAFMVGAGYEFADHVTVEALMLGTDIDDSDAVGLTYQSTSLQMTLNYHFY